MCQESSPDCINTPGSYICTCLTGFDNSTGACRGKASPKSSDNGRKPIEVVPHQPSVQLIQPTLVGADGRPIRLIPQTTGGTAGGTTSGRHLITNEVQTDAVVSRRPTLTFSPSFAATSRERNETQTIANRTIVTRPTTTSTTSTTSTTTNSVTPVQIESVSKDCALPCGPNAHCKLGETGTSCICDTGFNGDGITCVDTNECFMENSCKGNARCQNTLGSYTCLCGDGFKVEGSQCVDIDECEEGLVTCPGGNTSQCVNTHGGYECRCRQGYNGNPSSLLGCIGKSNCFLKKFQNGRQFLIRI